MSQPVTHNLKITICCALGAIAMLSTLLVSLPVLANNNDADLRAVIERLVVERAIEQFELDMSRCQVSVRRGLDHVPELDEFTLRPLTDKEMRGLVPALIEYRASDGESGRSQLTLSIRVFDSTLIAARSLGRGEELNPELVRTEWTDITDFRESPLSKVVDAGGYRLRRNMPAGKVITFSALEKIPDVNYGDEVTIELSVGALSLQALGSALEEGIVGETVRVRNVTSKKIIKATITAPGVVTAAGVR